MEKAYLLTALVAVFVASVDGLLYRRGIVGIMRLRARLVGLLPFGMAALVIWAGVNHGLIGVVYTSGCLSVFAIAHRYWYNVARDHHAFYVTSASRIDSVHMNAARFFGYHESYGGHFAMAIESFNALGMAIVTIIN